MSTFVKRETPILLRFFSIFSFLVLSVGAWGHEGPLATPKHEPHYFIENKGQWDSLILFKSELPQGNVLITKEGIIYQLFSHEPVHQTSSLNDQDPHFNFGNKLIKGQVVKITFGSTQFAHNVIRLNPISTHFQYLNGKSKTEEIKKTKAYTQLKLSEIYKGIDLQLYFLNGSLKYDFVVKPGAQPEAIQLRYEGADSLSLESNYLVIHTQVGKVYEKPPFSYQYKGAKTFQIPCSFNLDKNRVRFNIAHNYNRKETLVIDPELIFSTYSGAKANNFGNTATFDDDGNLYSGGIIFGDALLPITPGPFQKFNNGQIDSYILKFSPNGRDLLAAAYIGGSGNEFPISMIVKDNKELVILGTTGSRDFPITKNAFDTTFNGGKPFDAFYSSNAPFVSGTQFLQGSDIYIIKISTADFSLLNSTYLGGPDNDGILLAETPNVKNYGDQLRGEVMLDAGGNILIVSTTYSDTISNVPVNGISYLRNQGIQDALVAKLSPDLSVLNWTRFVGGNGYDCGFGIRSDKSNNVFITGGTTSANLFGASANGLHSSYTGNIDGYIAKISPNGDAITASTYLGTNAYDQCYFIDIDYNQDVYVVGQTRGSYAVSPNTYVNRNSGQFLHKLDNTLSTSYFSTVFGSGSGSPDMSLTAFMVNDCRKIFVSGWGGRTNSSLARYRCIPGEPDICTYDLGYVGGNTSQMPITRDAIQSKSDGSGFYFIVLHPEAKTLAYATHFSGEDEHHAEHVDGGTSRFDKRGIIYQSVCAGCGGFSNFNTPNKNVWSIKNNADCNNAALKIDLDKVIASFETFDSLKAIPSIYGCTPITFLLKNTSSGATNYKWLIGTKEFEVVDSLYINFTKRGKYDLTLIAFDTTICRQVDTARAVINAGDVRVDFPKDRINCGVQPFTADVRLYTPWAKVTWEPTTGVSDPTIANPVITPITDMQYVITIQDDTLCIKSDTFNLKVRNTSPLAKFEILDSLKLAEKYTFCYPSTGFFRSLSSGYDSLWWHENPGLGVFNIGVDSFPYPFSSLGRINYTLSVLDTACKKVSEDEKLVIISYPFVNFPSDQKICPDSSVTVSVTGDPSNTYVWSPSHLFPTPTASEQILNKDTTARIYIYVTDSIGCKVNGSFMYGLYGLLDPITDNEAKVCPKKVPGITIQSAELKEYNWVPGDSKSNTLYVSTEGKQYLFGKTLDGCPVRDSVLIVHRCDPEIHVPDAFTPDGDGRNDFFQVFGHEITAFDIKIFNRWGEIIYHSTDFRFQWDGTYRNQTVPIGTYPYIITYGGTTFEGDRIRKSLSGDITVVK